MRIAGYVGMHESQLRRDRLAHDDGPRLAQAIENCGVLVGLTFGEDGCSALCRHVLGINDVLKTYRHPMKGSDGVP